MRLVVLFALHVLRVQAGGTCQPITWDSDGALRVAQRDGNGTTTIPQSGTTLGMIGKGNLSPGDVHCRYATKTDKDVNYYTCTRMMEKYGLTNDLFFTLNPSLSRDCSNIRPESAYCVRGCKWYNRFDCPLEQSQLVSIDNQADGMCFMLYQTSSP